MKANFLPKQTSFQSERFSGRGRLPGAGFLPDAGAAAVSLFHYMRKEKRVARLSWIVNHICGFEG